MLKNEFEKLIGLVITDDEYNEIEKAYMSLPNSVNKKIFVKIWLKNGGIQNLFDKRNLVIQQLKEQVQENYDDAMSWCRDFNESASKLRITEEKLTAIKKIFAV